MNGAIILDLITILSKSLTAPCGQRHEPETTIYDNMICNASFERLCAACIAAKARSDFMSMIALGFLFLNDSC